MVGCPNIMKQAFTGKNINSLLNQAARVYINSNRGVSINSNELTLSKIYYWYKDDFGNNDQNILIHISKYADPDLKNALIQFTAISSYEYDWSLNCADCS